MTSFISYLSVIIGFAGVLTAVLLSFTIILTVISFLILALGIALLVFGVARVSLSFFLKSICSLPSREPIVALTFDDGPCENTEVILDILDQHNVKATFFCTGKQSEKHPATLKRILKSGHTIGSHTYSHNTSFTFSGLRNVISEIQRGADVIGQITGRRPLLFRPPFGVTNPIIAKGVKASGVISVGWNIRSFDTMTDDPGKLLARVMSKLKAGSIILLHDKGEATSEALPLIINEIHNLNLKPVNLEQALKIKVYESSDFSADDESAHDAE